MRDRPDDWQRARELFERLADLPAEERTAELARCGDAELRAWLEDLLDAHDSDELRESAAAELDLDRIPERIGPFRILSVIGAGGMGVVYRAEQDQPRRDVALKSIRPGLVSRATVHRFERETAILGRLEHEGIARVYSAGVEPAPERGGAERPYFAMELVDGRDLLTHASGLGVAKRIELLVEVCDAVQYAHECGVVHRDLKPGNILVDASGRPKVLDFGVARLAGSGEDAASTLHTRPGQIVGTLRYMSPEQIAGYESIDARADVYSLGAVAYELLSGHVPLELDGVAVAEAARIVRDEDPRPLSTWDAGLRGDLTSIFTKALEKSPAVRYASVRAMADDLRRYLNDEPVAARSAGTLYQLRKLARRHRAWAAGILVALGGMVAGTVVALVQAAEARDQARIAAAEAAEARAVNKYLRSIFELMDPQTVRGAAKDLPELFDRAEELVLRDSGELAPFPVAERDVRRVLAMAQRNLGRFGRAVDHFRRVLELDRELGDTAALGQDLFHYATCFLESSDTGGARTALNEIEELLAGTSSRRLVEVHGVLAQLDVTDLEYRSAVQHGRTAVEGDAVCAPPTRATHRNTLGRALFRLGMVDEAVDCFESGLAICDAAPETCRTTRLALLNQLANALDDDAATRERALGLRREALAARRDVYGPTHSSVALACYNFARSLQRAGAHEEAERLYREAIDTFRELGQAAFVARARSGYSEFLLARGRVDEAEPAMLGAHEELVTCFGESHPAVRSSHVRVAMLHRERGRFGQEAAHRRRALELQIAVTDPDSPTTLGFRKPLVDALLRAGESGAAARELGVLVELLRVRHGPDHETVLSASRKLEELSDG